MRRLAGAKQRQRTRGRQRMELFCLVASPMWSGCYQLFAFLVLGRKDAEAQKYSTSANLAPSTPPLGPPSSGTHPSTEFAEAMVRRPMRICKQKKARNCVEPPVSDLTPTVVGFSTTRPRIRLACSCQPPLASMLPRQQEVFNGDRPRVSAMGCPPDSDFFARPDRVPRGGLGFSRGRGLLICARLQQR